MDRHRASVLGLLALLMVVASCSPRQRIRPGYEPPPPTSINPTRIAYADAEAFDALLESALVNQDPAIVIETGHARPDWGARLNAWIAAWNRGGPPKDGSTFRSQIPGVSVDGETIREFRLLVGNLMDRIEERVRGGSAWWQEERTRNRRVTLLKPYNLRFHMAEDGTILIILFHGRYAAYYADFLQSFGSAETEQEWRRAYTCSLCRSLSAKKLDARASTVDPASSGRDRQDEQPGAE
jgi:hypothetical protein